MAIFNEYTPGLGSVGNYQVSGTPWITGSLIAASGNASPLNTSTQHIQFPYVTKEVTIVNRGQTELEIHLANDAGAAGVPNLGSHKFIIPPSGTVHGSPLARQTFDMKTKELFVTNRNNAVGAYQIYASVTRIDKLRMFELTGSGINSEPGDTTVTP
tara:strand:- start:3045 stop:3515 length:471 start_codon:yes stop_codon:yes gene_type:complete